MDLARYRLSLEREKYLNKRELKKLTAAWDDNLKLRLLDGRLPGIRWAELSHRVKHLERLHRINNRRMHGKLD